jgi:uncharacterized Zn-binding protein involved in type VI secretion
MPLAARSLDLHQCTLHEVPEVPTSGIIKPRVGATVFIGYQAAAREGDEVVCVLGGVKGTILAGASTVNIEGKPAARILDRIGHVEDPITGLGVPTGVIELGCLTVNIGSSTQAETLRVAADQGTAFCEECERGAGGAQGGGGR